MMTMEPLQHVQTIERPNGYRQIVWADGTPIRQRAWPRPTPMPAPEPTGQPSLSLLAVLGEVGWTPSLDRAPRVYTGPQRRRQAQEEEAQRAAQEPAPTAAQLREWRAAAGLSQRDAAALIGMERSTVAEVERGRRQNPDTRRRIGAVLERIAQRAGEGVPTGRG